MVEAFSSPALAGIEAGSLDPESPTFEAQIDSLRSELGAPNEPSLFPPYFLKSSFPKIGGRIVTFTRDGKIWAAAFLFPDVDGYVARLHAKPGDLEPITAYLEGLGARAYLSATSHLFEESHSHEDGVDIGRPSEAEARDIRRLQRIIWGSEPDFLYPYDIHSKEFNLPTSLVARINGRIIGFLFGFYKFGSALPGFWQERYRSDLRVESQLMGVLPDFRKSGIGFQLKRKQALKGREEGIDVINWTVDPLQFGNAVLNFGKLRAVAFEFYPNYYAFRNELNQVPASRISVSWFINSLRVMETLDKEAATIIHELDNVGGLIVVNNGFSEIHLEREAPVLAIEVPGDWTAVQAEDVEKALQWREATDLIFEHYLGPKSQGYAITDVGIDSRERTKRYYLLARKLDEIQGL